MGYGKIIRSSLVKFINNIGLVNNMYAGIGTIFMLHRVCPLEGNKLLSNERLKISPEFLERLILNLKNDGYSFISLDELHDILKSGKKINKQMVFTLDDGYVDNYEIAYPIFKKHAVPFTIYVTTSFPNRVAILWWYVLEDLILENEKIVLSRGREYICITIDEKNDAFNQIKKLIISLEKDNFLDNLNALFENYNIDWFGKSKELCMNWQQIIELSKDTLVTIGRHTVNHLALNQLSEDEIINEIVEANRMIENNINKRVEHFAYPFGSRFEIMERELSIVKNMNFKTATTTRKGNVYLEHIDYLECLPRFDLTENFKIEEIGKIRKEKIVTV